MSFFELSTPMHMLDKTRREHHRLQDEVNIDNVFNFMVTANHIRDYVKKSGAVPEPILNAFFQEQDMLDCQDLCNKGKHMTLERNRPDPSTRIMSSQIGAGYIGEMVVGSGDTWLLVSGDRKVDIVELADRVLHKLESFFSKHSI